MTCELGETGEPLEEDSHTYLLRTLLSEGAAAL